MNQEKFKAFSESDCQCGHGLFAHAYDDISPDDISTACYVRACPCTMYSSHCPVNKMDLSNDPSSSNNAKVNIIRASHRKQTRRISWQREKSELDKLLNEKEGKEEN